MTIEASPHIADRTLVDYATGGLKREQFRYVLAHVARCQECRRKYLAARSAFESFAERHKEPSS